MGAAALGHPTMGAALLSIPLQPPSLPQAPLCPMGGRLPYLPPIGALEGVSARQR